MDLHISNTKEWRNTTLKRAQAKAAGRKSSFATSSNIEVPDVTTAENIQDFAASEQLGYPGEFPFTRGIITDIFRFCTEQLPHWNGISISGYHIREAGSTAVYAFTLRRQGPP